RFPLWIVKEYFKKSSRGLERLADFSGVLGEGHFVALGVTRRVDPDVRMEDLVSNGFRKDPLSIECLLLCFRYLAHDLKICADVGHVPDPTMVRLGDHLGVPR